VGVVLSRVRARVGRFSAGTRSFASISIASSVLRFFFAGLSFAARSNFSSKRTGSVASSEASASSTAGPARVLPTFATCFLRDDRVFLATGASTGGAVRGPVPGILRGIFVAVATSPFETSFKGFFASFPASRVDRRLVTTMALPVPQPSPTFAGAEDAPVARRLRSRVAKNASPDSLDSLAGRPLACRAECRSRRGSANSNENPASEGSKKQWSAASETQKEFVSRYFETASRTNRDAPQMRFRASIDRIAKITVAGRFKGLDWTSAVARDRRARPVLVCAPRSLDVSPRRDWKRAHARGLARVVNTLEGTLVRPLQSARRARRSARPVALMSAPGAEAGEEGAAAGAEPRVEAIPSPVEIPETASFSQNHPEAPSGFVVSDVADGSWRARFHREYARGGCARGGYARDGASLMRALASASAYFPARDGPALGPPNPSEDGDATTSGLPSTNGDAMDADDVARPNRLYDASVAHSEAWAHALLETSRAQSSSLATGFEPIEQRWSSSRKKKKTRPRPRPLRPPPRRIEKPGNRTPRPGPC
jgi:hypothetical protein